MDTVAAFDDPVSAWLRFGLQRHGRVMVVGFRDTSIPIDLDRVFVPLYVYADTRRTGGPDARGDKDGLAHSGKEISFDEALACASDGRTCLALIGDPGAGKTTLLRHLFRRVVRGEVTGPVVHLVGLHPALVPRGGAPFFWRHRLARRGRVSRARQGVLAARGTRDPGVAHEQSPARDDGQSADAVDAVPGAL
jgi:hypothetical protein